MSSVSILPLAGNAGDARPAAGDARYRPLPLDAYRNNTAITAAGDLGAGAFNVWRNSYAAEYLPAGGAVTVGGVPFDFPPAGPSVADNVRCAGQFLTVPAGRYDWLHLIAAAERRTEDLIWTHFADAGVEPEFLRVSDFWAAPAWFGEARAFRSPVMHYPHHVQAGVSAELWALRVPISRRGVLTGVRLPRNVAVHLFAATLQLGVDS